MAGADESATEDADTDDESAATTDGSSTTTDGSGAPTDGDGASTDRVATADRTAGRPCPLCGEPMYERHCKYVCPQHGVVYDCSDTFY